jgi:predicted transcriptional regulator
MGGKYAFIMMVQSKWWNEFRLPQRNPVQSYVQTGMAPPKEASLILFYVTKPVGEVAGYAEFIERKTGDAEKLWNEYGSESVLYSKAKYDEYLGGKKKVSIIRFKGLHVASKPIPLSNVLLLLGMKRLSRKGFYVDKETADRLIELMECRA